MVALAHRYRDSVLAYFHY